MVEPLDDWDDADDKIRQHYVDVIGRRIMPIVVETILGMLNCDDVKENMYDDLCDIYNEVGDEIGDEIDIDTPINEVIVGIKNFIRQTYLIQPT